MDAPNDAPSDAPAAWCNEPSEMDAQDVVGLRYRLGERIRVLFFR